MQRPETIGDVEELTFHVARSRELVPQGAVGRDDLHLKRARVAPHLHRALELAALHVLPAAGSSTVPGSVSVRSLMSSLSAVVKSADTVTASADAAGTDAQLHVRDDLTLDPLQVGEHVHEHADDDRRLDAHQHVDVFFEEIDEVHRDYFSPPYRAPGASITELSVFE